MLILFRDECFFLITANVMLSKMYYKAIYCCYLTFQYSRFCGRPGVCIDEFCVWIVKLWMYNRLNLLHRTINKTIPISCSAGLNLVLPLKFYWKLTQELMISVILVKDQEELQNLHIAVQLSLFALYSPRIATEMAYQFNSLPLLCAL